MGPIEHIRKNILEMSQTQFGRVAGVTQATVSRWESGDLEPSRAELIAIRRSVAERGANWNDTWFFEVPLAHAETAA